MSNKQSLIDNYKNRTTTIRVLLILTLFFTIFSIKISYLPPLFDLRVLVMLIVLTAVFFKIFLNSTFNLVAYRHEVLYVGSFLTLMLYAAVIVTFNNAWTSDKSVFPFMFNYFALVVVFPFFLKEIFRNEYEFADALTTATLIQSIIVIMSFAFPVVKDFLYDIQEIGNDRFLNRIVGLGVIGAKGSVYLFCGFMVNAYIVIFKKYKTKHLFSLIIIFSAIMLVGRTGFYLACCVLVIIFMMAGESFVKRLKFMFSLFGSLILIFIIAQIIKAYSLFTLNTELLFYTLRRLDEILGNSVTFEILSTMEVPPLSLETFIGIGEIKGQLASGLLIWHDSGYIQQYLALGLIGAFLFYFIQVIYFTYLIKRIGNKSERLYWYLMLTFLFIIEYKEPFILALAYPVTILMMIKLSSNQNKIKDVNIGLKEQYSDAR